MKKLWVLAVVVLWWLAGAAGQAGADAPVHKLVGDLGALPPGDTSGTTARIDRSVVNRAVSFSVSGNSPWRPAAQWTNSERPTHNSQFASFNLSPVQTASRVDFGYALGIGGNNNAGDFGGSAGVGFDIWRTSEWTNHFQLSKGPEYSDTTSIEIKVLVAGGGTIWNALHKDFTL